MLFHRRRRWRWTPRPSLAVLDLAPGLWASASVSGPQADVLSLPKMFTDQFAGDENVDGELPKYPLRVLGMSASELVRTVPSANAQCRWRDAPFLLGRMTFDAAPRSLRWKVFAWFLTVRESVGAGSPAGFSDERLALRVGENGCIGSTMGTVVGRPRNGATGF